QFISELVARVLGLDAAAGIDPDRPLAELGVDSLISIDLRNAIGRSLGRTLAATALFEYPTIAALAGWLADATAVAAPPTRAEAPREAAPRPAPVEAAPEEDLSKLDDAALAALLRAELDDEGAQ
ncbi:MAG: hypothetical protein KC620_20625, partial [Myxococcales bacterium]|nr:hypothetical protein [Myxococcales bacterium]